MKFSIKGLFDPSKKALKNAHSRVEAIQEYLQKYKIYSDAQIRDEILAIRKEVTKLAEEIPAQYKISLMPANKDESYVQKEHKLQAFLLEKIPQVYAAIGEILQRKIGYSHFPVQLTAAVILAQGYKLTELKTGEGKTLVFQLPAALYGLTGRGSHVVTANDYLAKRDGEYAGHILHDVGITVGIITPDQSFRFVSDEEALALKGDEIKEALSKQKVKNPGDCEGLNLIECTKKEAYACDVVYGTNNEFGFDYLRDNMTMNLENISQRELYFCIVDEADSILIDEARTPLIISSAAEESNELYVRFADLVPHLTKDEDYTVDEKAHAVFLTDNGSEKMEKMLGVSNIWQDYALAHHLENALKAEVFYKNDVDYIVSNGEVKIVDEFTGRILEGRRYSEGLHQAIEAKEKVAIKQESRTLGTITFQNFFRLYKILAGGSGTILTEAEEFYKIYNLESIEVPTNKTTIRIDHIDRVYKNRKVKFEAVVEEIIKMHEKGQPVLVGTTSIEDSEYLSKLLELKGLEHQVLNAKYHERESKIVANAGKKGAITVATNMAGRGTDIKLGGKNATDEEFQEVVSLGGLAVLGTQRHEARRIDNQLRGRSGRQGEPGMTRFYVSLDDDIMRIQGGDIVKRVMDMTNLPENLPIEARSVGRSIEGAQKRMEGMHFDVRKTVVEYDDVVNQQREIFYSRRRRILELLDNVTKAFDKKDSEEAEENLKLAKTDILNMLGEKMHKEIDLIIKQHLDVEQQTFDLEKVIEDYLDLAPDRLATAALEQLNLTNESNASKALKQINQSKSPAEFQEVLNSVCDKMIEIKIPEFGNDLPMVAKLLILRTMDQLWTEHLDSMKALREGIGLRGYAQQDPLVEYKNEGFEMFDNLIANIDSQIARRFLKIQRVVNQLDPQQREQIRTNVEEVKDVNTGTREIKDLIKSGKAKSERSAFAQPSRTGSSKPISKGITISRNDKVTVRYSDGRVQENVKFKKVENDVKSGLATVIKR